MAGLFVVLYGVAVYAFFVVTFLYAIGFVGNIVVPKTIDSGTPGPLVESLVVNAWLLLFFAMQHSGMARRAFKRWWMGIVPEAIERSTYVLFATSALALLCWQWRPIIDPVIWSVRDPLVMALFRMDFWFGWTLLLLSTFLINHFELFGLRQVLGHLFGWEPPQPVFKTPFVYKRVRHPIYLGFLLAFWSTAVMTAGHLLFAAATTGYILIGIYLEERDLIALFGDQHRRYRRQVGMLFPLPGRRYADDRPVERPRAAELRQS